MVFQLFKSLFIHDCYLTLSGNKQIEVFSLDNKELNQEIGRRIATQRQKAGMTQEAVAEALGIGNEAVSRLERGTVAASVPRLMELAALFGCRTGDFFMEQSVLLSEQSSEITELLSRISPEARRFVLEQLRHSIQWLETQEKRYEIQ